jgi:hypothetical protein
MHDRIAEDPDVAQAIEDKLPDIAEIRDLLVRPSGRVTSERIGELFADIHLRAERLRVDPHELIRMASAEFDRRYGKASAGRTVRSKLALIESQAIGREQAAHVALSRAQAEMAAATLARQHAQSRCLAFGVPVHQ